jgi:hypothetical protein
MSAIHTPGEVYMPEKRDTWTDSVSSLKRSTTVDTRDVERGEEAQIIDGSIHWQTGFRARFPWIGYIKFEDSHSIGVNIVPASEQ